MILFPNAKINLGLRVLKKRDDGFHEIESCLYPIPICDILEILPSDKSNFRFSGSDLQVAKEDNLCFKAWLAISEKYNLKGIYLHLHKIIPHGAGLGGGSSDAAFTLKGINKFYDLNLSSELQEISSQLGSDCPFFLKNTAQLATGRGEKLKEVSVTLHNYFGIIIKPKFSISTAEAYSLIKPNPEVENLESILKLKPEQWKGGLVNDFESVLENKYPELKVIRNKLYDSGAVYASMSGSGSAYFGIFRNPPNLKTLDLPESYFKRVFSLN